MLKLSAPRKSFITGFRLARANVFNGLVAQPGFDASAVTGLTWAGRFVTHLQTNLDVLLTGTPKALLKQIGDIESDADFKHFAAYCALPKPPKTHAMRPLYDLVKKLFDYDAMCVDRTTGAYAVVKEHGQRICPYCQMHHLNFHLGAVKTGLKLRPPLDHFFPRSVYPYLGTSLFNLIPSCEQCNSRIKLARDPRGSGSTAPLAHPFDITVPLSFESGWTSGLPLDRISTAGDFQFRFAGTDAPSNHFAAFFRLTERYDWYEHELLDIVKNYRRLLDLDPTLSSAVDPIQYILGFPASEARNRNVGVMLVDAARRIVATAAAKP